ncbi:MAG: chloride channel protein [Planctomycetes bacterium]|nr:chloride channel protein [Planctomycetota bacterium]
MRLPKLEPETKFLILAAAIGAAGALVDAGFRALIALSHRVFVSGTAELFTPMGLGWKPLLVLLAPALGGLAVGALGRFSHTEVGGYALPAFLEKVNLNAAGLTLKSTVLRGLAAALTLGSGGSAGVEGPIASLGGGIAAWIARARQLVGERLRVLIACGSSAAVAAAYGAPIAGVFFTQEIVLAGNYDLQNFVRVVVASGSATVVARAIRGDAPLFEVAPFQLIGPSELLFYLALGLACGFCGATFSRLFFRTKRLFASSRVPPLWQPALGGALVGAIAIFVPGVLGIGHEVIESVLGADSIALGGLTLALVLLVVGKLIATCITIGSGGAGGIFGPSLCLGAVLGALVGSVADHFWHAQTSIPAHYALVGMGAFLAATVRAPLTSIFLVFEMTGSSSAAVLPTILAVAASLVVARRFERRSIDDTELAGRGVHLHQGREVTVLAGVTCGEAMDREFASVPATASAPELQALLAHSKANAYVVLDFEDRLVGILSVQDLRVLDPATAEQLGSLAIASELCERNVITVFEDEPLTAALSKIDQHGFRQLPVVDRADPRRVVGLLERRHVLAAYRRHLALRDSDSAANRDASAT